MNLAAAERNYFDDRILLTSSSSRPFYGVCSLRKASERAQRERDEKEQKTLTKKTRKNLRFSLFCLLFRSFSLFFSLFLSFSLFSQESFLAQRMPYLTLSLVISRIAQNFIYTFDFPHNEKLARTLSHSHSHSHYL
tara:strand:- start:2540 stop:2947 length:408 start_codon:yes stop_codon:yes gene_type:complete